MGKGNWKCKVTASASSTSNTAYTIKGTCIWDSNDWSYNMSSVTGKVTVNGKTSTVFDNGSVNCSSGNTKTLGSYSKSISRTHSDQTITVSAEIISKSTYSSGDKTASTTINVPKKPSYSVTYSASGASNVPGSQTKWYDENLTLSTTKPTKTGYTFSKWVSGSSGYSAGATYTGNAALALTAQWTENTATLNYNANGGSLASGMSGSVTMRYSAATTIQSGTPTRAGYTFLGWSTSSTATSASYTAGNTYKAANVNPSGATLYAVWRINTWTVSYNVNGGSGAPGNQTKTYNRNLTLSTTKPTKTAYNFKGWSTTLNGSVAYQPGATYTGNAALNLYAVWELAHVKPIITNSNGNNNAITAYRCDSSGIDDDEGQNIRVIFNWKTEDDVTSVQIRYKLLSATSFTNITVSASGKSNTVDQVIGSNSLTTEETYQVKVYVADGSGAAYENESAIVNIAPPTYPIDVLRGGKGIAFGGVAKNNYRSEFYFTPWAYPNPNGSGSVYFVANSNITGTTYTVCYGIGSGGVNRGIYDTYFDKWLFYADATNVYLQSNGIIKCNNTMQANTNFAIPKNGSDGYGITNTDGVSIIRDHNNTNVTVDATGGTLFLGYQDTTQLNLMNSNAYIKSDGSIYPGPNNNGGIYFDKYGNIITKGALTSGNWHIQNNGSNKVWINWADGHVHFSNNLYCNYVEVPNGVKTSEGSLWAGTADASGKGVRCNSNGNLVVCGSVYADYGSMRFKNIYDADVVSNATNMYITSNGWIRRTTNTSLLAHKTDIKAVESDTLNPEKLYDLEVKQFKYKKEYQPSEYDIRYEKDLIGFIAEDVEKIYPVAVDYEYDVDHDNDENINDYEKDTVKNVKRALINWNERYLIPPMLKLIQNHKKEIDDLKVKIAALEQRLAALENKGGN